jgi:hypothetical protein
MSSHLLFDCDRSAVVTQEATTLPGSMVQERLSQNQQSLHLPLRAAAARRSVQNILQWNSYLPPACVKTMVRLGWDYTT